MLPEASSFLQIFKTTIDAIRGVSDAEKRQAISKSVIELQEKHEELHRAYLELQAENSKLRNLCEELKANAVQLSRYRICKLPLGGIVYELAEAHKGDDPAHYACATCIEKRIRSILQPDAEGQFLVCPVCGNKVKIKHDRSPVDPTVSPNPWKRDGIW